MFRDPDHELVGSILRQSAGIDTTSLEKQQRSRDTRPLIAVKVGLTLGKTKSVCRSDFVVVAAGIVEDVLCCRDGRL